MHPTPPAFAIKLIELSLPYHLSEPVLGDLEEAFLLKIEKTSLFEAQLWFWRQAITSALYFMTNKDKAMSKRNRTILVTCLIFSLSVTLFYINMESYQKERLALVIDKLLSTTQAE